MRRQIEEGAQLLSETWRPAVRGNPEVREIFAQERTFRPAWTAAGTAAALCVPLLTE